MLNGVLLWKIKNGIKLFLSKIVLKLKNVNIIVRDGY